MLYANTEAQVGLFSKALPFLLPTEFDRLQIRRYA
jgi:hypothetical protein